MKETIKIKNKNISKALSLPAISLPKYSSNVINKANGYARATRPENVSQVSETIKEFRDDITVPNHSYEEWVKWYESRYPDAISKATNDTWDKFQDVLRSLAEVKKEDIEAWERDFIISKTYSGLMVQDAIIKLIAEKLGVQSRLGDTADEQKGIDGYVNDIPVQIKAATFEQDNHNERFADGIVMIYYTKEGRTGDITFSYNVEDFVK